MTEATQQQGVILVVDDNEDNRIIAATNLEMDGHTVLEAEDGQPALERLAATRVDLVLLDIMMPGMNGYEVCRRMRADESLRGVKVLMLTAKASTNDLVQGFAAGADDYVTKPFEIDELLARVRNLVGLKRAEDELLRLNADLEGEVERRARELARSEARYRTIFNAVPLSIMLLDQDGRVGAVNAWHEGDPTLAALYGPALVGTRLPDHPGAIVLGIADGMHDLLQGAGFEHQGPIAVRGTADEQAYIRVRGVPIRSHDGGVEGALVLHEDLTEERRLQQQALEAEKLASIGTLAQGVAHNFNNLLFVVSGSLEILKASGGDALRQKPFEQARMAIARMGALTRQLATFSRLGEEGRHPVNVVALLRDVVGSFQGNVPEGVQVTVDSPDDLPLVHACPSELFQAFGGIIQNAIEAMPKGGEVRVSLRVGRWRGDGSPRAELPALVCEVADNGVGMDEETKRRAFEPFFTSKQTVGVGLGLSTVHGIVRSHGGWIELESTRGQGTRVTVTLPACDQGQLDALRPALDHAGSEESIP
jgi:two-component system cell cycle sensor histidine kinase/response regulator CckA